MQESILLFFQNTETPFLDHLFELITMLGEKNVLIVVITWMFWNVNKKKGFILSYTLMFSLLVNSALKISFHKPRPFQVLSGITGKRVETATGYSFPSGHTQGASTFYPTLALLFRKWWLYGFAVLISMLIALSRVYLGVHWPVDVIAAFILGIMVSLILYNILNILFDNIKLRNNFIIYSSFGAVILLIIFVLINKQYFDSLLILTDLFKTVGVFLGASLGFIFEEKYSSFSVSGKFLKKCLRFFIGLVLTLVLLSGLKLIFPTTSVFNFIRYGIVGIWITWLYPAVGIKTGLFRRD